MRRIEITKENCIATTHPEIAAQWNLTLNKGISPFDVRAGSTDRVWWLCDKGHSWKTEVRVRCQRNSGCPYCRGKYVVKGETDLESQRPDLAKEWDFEENGDYTPDKAPVHSPRNVGWICEKGHKWMAKIANRAKNDGCPYCSGRRAIPGETDLATLTPDLLKYWDYEKNDELGIFPTNVMPYSKTMAGWVCEKGHKWMARIANRVNGRGCPYCSGRRAIPGETDLATLTPDLLKYWDYEKNDELGIFPTNVMPYSKTMAGWVCEKGHKWMAKIANRVNGRGCPYCAGKKILAGYNDLETLNPELAKEWHPTKNNGVLPSQISPNSKKRVWWLGRCGHEWEARIYHRNRGSGCLYCTGQLPIVGKTDLATLMPKIAEEWNYEKNGGKTPQMFTMFSNEKVWWKCKEGHEWPAAPSTRTLNGCPYCAGKKILAGYNDLETLNPELAKEWHPTKNNGVLPSQISPNSKKRVWWLGRCGHEWEARIYHRNRGSGCLYCTGQLPIVGKTDLATLTPKIAEEWNYEKNRGKTPQMFTNFSPKKVWWKCEEGHEWRTRIKDRTRKGSGCPICIKIVENDKRKVGG